MENDLVRPVGVYSGEVVGASSRSRPARALHEPIPFFAYSVLRNGIVTAVSRKKIPSLRFVLEKLTSLISAISSGKGSMRLCAVMIVARLRCFCFLGYSEVNFYYQVDSNRRLLDHFSKVYSSIEFF